MADIRLVLDTHVWLWAVSGDKTLKLGARQRITEALRKGIVLVPAISVWEVAMLWKRKRIQLAQPLHEWIPEALHKPGFVLSPLTEEVSVDAASLPGANLNDSADCMIVATARSNKAVLLTRDSRIIEYGRTGNVNLLEV